MVKSLSFVLIATLAVGCKWTDFDDLEDETWVSTIGKPNSDSSDYGVALARGLKTSASGGKLVVLGSGQAQYTEQVFSGNGDSELANPLKLNSQFAIGNLDAQPILISDPASDDVSLVTPSGGTSIFLFTPNSAVKMHQVFGPASPDAAVYLDPPARADMPGSDPPAQPIVGSGDAVYGAYTLTDTPNVQPKCPLVDDMNQAISIRGLGAARITQTATDDLVVWTATGKLLIYPGDVFNGALPFGTSCGVDAMSAKASPLAGATVVDTGFMPAKGSQIQMIDGKYALLIGHKDVGDSASFLAVYDVTAGAPGAVTPTRIGTPVTAPDLRTATLLDAPTGRFIAAGYPTATFDGVRAGHVLLYPFDTTTGISATPAATLNDAQPENDQAFGRALVAFPFNGKNVLAVSADNEVFVYFRTTLYDETRAR